MRRFSIALTLLMTLILAAPALAQDSSFTIAVEGVADGAEGDVIQVAEQAVDPALVGASCTVTASTENNSSVHPGNELIIATGGTEGTIPGVEEQPGQTLTLAGSVVLGETVTVSLRFGPDGVTSGGVVLTFDCAAAAAPVGGVATGAGGTAGSDTSSFVLLGVGTMAVIAAGGLAASRWRVSRSGAIGKL